MTVRILPHPTATARPASRTTVWVIISLLAAACTAPVVRSEVEELAVRSDRRGVRITAGDELFALTLGSMGEPVSVVDLMAHGGRPALRGFPLATRPGESVDHPEHHGLWTGHGSVDGHDLWERADRIKLVSDSFRVEGTAVVRLDLRLHWTDPDGVLLCDESRTLRFESTTKVRSLDCVHRLRATGSGVTFGDDRRGFFAVRLADDFQLTNPGARRLVGVGAKAAEGTKGAVEESGDAPTEGDVEGDRDAWGRRARWIATVADVEGADGTRSPVTVAVFDHPGNHGFPTRWNARPYGLVAANPFAVNDFVEGAGSAFHAFESRATSGEVRLEPYGVLELRYRVIVATSALDAASIEDLWQRFAGSVE